MGGMADQVNLDKKTLEKLKLKLLGGPEPIKARWLAGPSPSRRRRRPGR